MANDRLHLLGIRHHGPGSAHSVVRALDEIDPEVVLIEGPPEVDPLLAFAAAADMKPPVALLIYEEARPQNALFDPFATFSPEWQALTWALRRQRTVRFIDLPAAHRLAIEAASAAGGEAGIEEPATPVEEEAVADDDPKKSLDEGLPYTDGEDTGGEETGGEETARTIRRDPIAALADLAGHEDGEAWWSQLVEEQGGGPSLFAAIETAMTALREGETPPPPLARSRIDDENRLEAEREAHMRLEIGKALKAASGPVAAVVGAWHVPALRRKVAAKDDRAILKELPKTRIAATWIPWTNTRLAFASGYRAGVRSPGWYGHIWHAFQSATDDADRRHRLGTGWAVRAAVLLREAGLIVSTASVIEAQRLAHALASLRGRSTPGLGDLRDALRATLCGGDDAPFRLIEDALVIGSAVGEVGEATPQNPLQADLARQQKRLRLKPEALPTDLSLDLRSEAGFAKSVLLHRLRLIGIPWGEPAGSGRSRGTFRENWTLVWQPEFSVRLAEAVVYGTTIETAAAGRAVAAAAEERNLGGLAELVQGCLYADLAEAARGCIRTLQEAASQSDEVTALIDAASPLVNVRRYGDARRMPTEALDLLVSSLVEQVLVALPYAARQLEPEAARALKYRVGQFDQSVSLLEAEHVTDAWARTLARVADDGEATPLIAGQAARLLYDRQVIDSGGAGGYLGRALSPAAAPLAASGWLEGFLAEAGQVLLFDDALRGIIEAWVSDVGDDDFLEILPMLRRAFATLDASERRQLLDRVGSRSGAAGVTPELPEDPAADAAFEAALPLLKTMLGLTP